eukprot:COSAG02_NODE_3861_length_6130_cov_16.333112_1_plen_105_part_00
MILDCLWITCLVKLPETCGDTPTLAEMDAYVAQRVTADLSILAKMQNRSKQLWVSTTGSPDGSGSKTEPLTLETAFTSPNVVEPGTIVWCDSSSRNAVWPGCLD